MEREISFGPLDIESDLPQTLPIEVDAGTDIETVDGGRLVRTRRALHAELEITAERDDGLGAPDDDGAQHRARPPRTRTRRSPCR